MAALTSIATAALGASFIHLRALGLATADGANAIMVLGTDWLERARRTCISAYSRQRVLCVYDSNEAVRKYSFFFKFPI